MTYLDDKINQLKKVLPEYEIVFKITTRKGKESKRGSEIKIDAIRHHPKYGCCRIYFQCEKYFLSEDFAPDYIKKTITKQYRYAVRERNKKEVKK